MKKSEIPSPKRGEKNESASPKRPAEMVNGQSSMANGRKRKMSFREKQEFEALGKEIDDLENEKADIEAALSSGALCTQEIIDLSKRGKTAVEPSLKHNRASLSLIQHPADNPLRKQQRPFDQPVLACIHRKLGVSAKHTIRQGTHFQHSLYSVFHSKTAFFRLCNIDPQTTFLDNSSLYRKSRMPKSIFLSVRRYAHPSVNRQIPIPKRI